MDCFRRVGRSTELLRIDIPAQAECFVLDRQLNVTAITPCYESNLVTISSADDDAIV